MGNLTHFKKRKSVPLLGGQAEGLGVVVTPAKSETTPKATPSPLDRGTGNNYKSSDFVDVGMGQSSTPFKGSERSSGGRAKLQPKATATFKRVNYNKNLVKRAKVMSREMTNAEKQIWFDLLSKKQLLGLKFIKQKIVFNYILDFYCSELVLAIEIDGESHVTKLDYDKVRDDFIQSCGIKVVRLSNSDVLNNLAGVREFLVRKIEEIT